MVLQSGATSHKLAKSSDNEDCKGSGGEDLKDSSDGARGGRRREKRCYFQDENKFHIANDSERGRQKQEVQRFNYWTMKLGLTATTRQLSCAMGSQCIIVIVIMMRMMMMMMTDDDGDCGGYNNHEW